MTHLSKSNQPQVNSDSEQLCSSKVPQKVWCCLLLRGKESGKKLLADTELLCILCLAFRRWKTTGRKQEVEKIAGTATYK